MGTLVLCYEFMQKLLLPLHFIDLLVADILIWWICTAVVFVQYMCAGCTIYFCAVDLHDLFKFKFPTTGAKNWCAQIQLHQISFISLQVVVLVQLMVCLLSFSVHLWRISTITLYLSTSAITVVMAWISNNMWFLLPLSFLGEAAPEKYCNQAAIEHTSLPLSLYSIPLGSCVVGDAAYTQIDKCITPFTCWKLHEMHFSIILDKVGLELSWFLDYLLQMSNFQLSLISITLYLGWIAGVH